MRAAFESGLPASVSALRRACGLQRVGLEGPNATGSPRRLGFTPRRSRRLFPRMVLTPPCSGVQVSCASFRPWNRSRIDRRNGHPTVALHGFTLARERRTVTLHGFTVVREPQTVERHSLTLARDPPTVAFHGFRLACDAWTLTLHRFTLTPESWRVTLHGFTLARGPQTVRRGRIVASERVLIRKQRRVEPAERTQMRPVEMRPWVRLAARCNVRMACNSRNGIRRANPPHK